MLPIDDCDDCTPAYLHRRLPPSTIVLSSLPFVFTFFIVATVVSQKILPLLTGQTLPTKQEQRIPLNAKDESKSRHRWGIWHNVTAKRVAAVACVVTIALSSVLVELILCEISNSLNPAVRGIALNTTLFLLLLLIILVLPALEISSVAVSYTHLTLPTKRIV